MTKQEFFKYTAALTSALVETTEPGETIPASTLYMVLGMDYEAYTTLAGLLSRAGLVEVTKTTIALTEKGRQVGRDVNAVAGT